MLRTLTTAGRFVLASRLGIPQLLAVGWSITHVCNARCPFCDRHSGAWGVDTATAHRLIDELAEAGCRRVHFTGGEPFVRDDLPELLAHVAERGMTRSVNTNGSLITRRLEVLDQSDAFLISVDGPRDVHDRYRGSGFFEKMLAGVELLQQRRKPFVFSVTLFKENLEHLDFFVELARRFDTRIVLQPGATHVLGSRDPNPEVPDVARYRAVLQRVLDEPSLARWVWNSRPGLTELLRWPERHRLRSHAGRITCRLEVDGGLYPCSRAVLDPSCNPAPNVLTLGVAEAFRRLPEIDCSEHVCQCAHNVEKSLLFAWNPAAAFSYATRNYVRARWA